MTEYIKREDLMERVGRWQLNTREAITEMIMSVPSADVIEQETKCACVPSVWTDGEASTYVLQRHGKWLHKKITDDFHVIGQCSVCKEIRRIDNFCPNCGADLREER